MSSANEFIPSVTRAAKTQVRRTSRRGRWILGGLGVVLLIGLGWYLSGLLFAPAKKAPPPPTVRTAIAQRRDVTIIVKTIGTVVSPATVQVTAQVQGKLLQAYFQEGQIVRKGDPLFLIDPGPFQNALAQARAGLAKDQATAAAALNDEKRYTALYAQNAISQQARDQAVAAARADAATVQADQATVNIAAENLGYTKITSPINGKTGPLLIQPGNLVTVAGTTPLVTIAQIQPIKLSFFLPQGQLTQIQNQLAAGKLKAFVPMPGGQEEANVDFISNAVNTGSGSIELRATFPNLDQRLVPGQSVNVGVIINQIAGATVVPRDAVNAGPSGSYVYVLATQNNKTVALSKPVKVLNDDGTSDAIQGDIKPGDRVVTDGQILIVSGAQVQEQKAGSAGSAGNGTPS